MSDLSDKYYSKSELLSIVKKIKLPEKYFEDFIVFIEKDIQIMTDEGEMDYDEIKRAAIDFAKEYFDKYEIEIQKGHSKEWAHEYAESCEEHAYAFNDAYKAIKEIDPDKAKKELEIHFRAMGGDQLYRDHFIFLIENGGDLSTLDKQASMYSTIFKEQIARGKSEVFAHQYADLKAEEKYAEQYCFWYAKSYDECIQNGKSEKYAELFADKMGDYYSDYYGRYIEDERIDTENHEYKAREILGNMNGWEYALEHQLKKSKAFIDYYDNLYMNTYYDDNKDYNISDEELDKDILKRALDKYNIFMDKQKNS